MFELIREFEVTVPTTVWNVILERKPRNSNGYEESRWRACVLKAQSCPASFMDGEFRGVSDRTARGTGNQDEGLIRPIRSTSD
jgi:hypothetical protein